MQNSFGKASTASTYLGTFLIFLSSSNLKHFIFLGIKTYQHV